MIVVEVVPISRGIFRDRLSYYTNQSVSPGMIVNVNLRRRLTPALVVKIDDLTNLKASLKQADYPLKKITSVNPYWFFPPELVEAAESVSQFHIAPLGQVLKAMIPQAILDNLSSRKKLPTKKTLNIYQAPEKNFPSEKLALQQPLVERIAFYRGLVRGQFAKKQSVWFILPTINQTSRLAEELGRGIEDRTIVLHGSLAKNELLERWQKAVADEQPLLLITTPLALALPRTDWSVLVVEEESAGAYKSIRRPFLDGRRLAENLVKSTGRTIIFGDTVFRPELVRRLETGELEPAAPIKQRLLATAETLISAYLEPDEVNRIIGPDLRTMITDAGTNSRLIILTAKRGLNPIVICGDCGHIIVCRRCQGPIALHRQPTKTANTEEPNLLICHRCHENRRVDRRCPHCSGWRLTAWGVGIEQVREELNRLFPDRPVWQIDSDQTPTRTQAERIKKRWLTEGGILLGTELALNLVSESVDYGAVIALDSLLALPDFRIGQKIFQQLINLRELILKRLVIQTREPDNPLYLNVKRGNLTDFWRQEMADRQVFNYPPFKTLIKISRRGQIAEVTADMEKLENLLTGYEAEFFDAFNPLSGGQFVSHALLRLSPERWPNSNLSDKLKSLSASFEIDVDPQSLL